MRVGGEFVRLLVAKGFRVFLDLKFHDIPNTVAQACSAAADLGVWMVNVHAAGGLAMMEAARDALKPYGPNRPYLIAVTTLTSMAETDLKAIGIQETLLDHVCRLALLAQEAGLRGVVCSAQEVARIKALCGPTFLTVTPGIRLPGDATHDQHRVTSPQMALESGTDFMVVGRSITCSPNPAAVVREVLGYV